MFKMKKAITSQDIGIWSHRLEIGEKPGLSTSLFRGSSNFSAEKRR